MGNENNGLTSDGHMTNEQRDKRLRTIAIISTFGGLLFGY